MAVDFSALRTKLITTLKANKTHSVTILVPQNAAPADATKPHRVTEEDPTEHDVDVVCADIPLPNTSGEGATGIMDRNVLVPGDVGVVPDTNMRIRFADGSEWSIVAKSTYDQGGVDIGYKLRISAWPASSTQPTA